MKYLVKPPPHGALLSNEGVAVRTYESYDAYIGHQRSKLDLLDLRDYDRTFRAGLAERLRANDWKGKSALCLAARIGTEVKAFHDVGAFAVGIDLNPGSENTWVLRGDFHELVFPDGSVDAVYCNSLDHALDLRKALSEVKRVLKPGGLLLIDAQRGGAQAPFDEWAATEWATIDHLVEVVTSTGFCLLRRQLITVPWHGEELRFQPAGE